MPTSETIQILAISGSLRSDSTNHLILQTLQQLASSDMAITIFDGLDRFPHFNPGSDPSEAVTSFRKAVGESAAVIISTPEYAFGVPGTLKNALDWMVSSGEFNEKPVAAISASPLWSGGDKALASLLLTLQALGTIRTPAMHLSIPLIKTKISNGKLTDPETLSNLHDLLINLRTSIPQK